MEEGRAPDAEVLLRKALHEFRAAGSLDEEGLALSVLIEALVVQGRLADARGTLERADEISRKTENVHARLRMGIAGARLNAALGKAATATKKLEALLSLAEAAGFYGEQLDARLALGGIAMKSGEASAGRARLEALEAEADARGYGLIARKASAALRATVTPLAGELDSVRGPSAILDSSVARRASPGLYAGRPG